MTQTPIRDGDTATYHGHPATVVHGYDPADPWLPAPDQRREPSVNIRFDRAVPGMSRQMDVPVSAVLSA